MLIFFAYMIFLYQEQDTALRCSGQNETLLRTTELPGRCHHLNKQVFKKAGTVMIAIAILLVAVFAGYSIGINSPAPQDTPIAGTHTEPTQAQSPTQDAETETVPKNEHPTVPIQLLNITVTASEGWIDIIQPEDLGGNMDYPLSYSGIKDVMIDIDGVAKELEYAIRDGDISLAEIFTYARADAENGFCEVNIRSKNGLSSFLYSYPEYDLKLIYDVYETPDGENHLISDMALYKPGGEIPRIYLNESDKILDLEDWGISLEVVETSADGITLSCTQSGGQQIGTLSAYAFRLIQDGKYMSALDGDTTTSYEIPETALSANSSTEFTIDWKDIYGTLSPGEYVIRVIVKDIYDKSQVHPLMRNFYDIQHYEITFTVS